MMSMYPKILFIIIDYLRPFPVNRVRMTGNFFIFFSIPKVRFADFRAIVCMLYNIGGHVLPWLLKIYSQTQKRYSSNFCFMAAIIHVLVLRATFNT